MKFSDNFYLYEFLASNKAEELGEDVIKEQNNPPQDVIARLCYLASTTLQPWRTFINHSTSVNSGWRCKSVNEAVGSNDKSQHLQGEAADIDIPESLLSSDDKLTVHAIGEIKRTAERIMGRPVRDDVNANYYVWAYMCINLDNLDIDQIIHEYGKDGKPAWIHVASSTRKSARRITIKRSGEGYLDVDLKTALELGA